MNNIHSLDNNNKQSKQLATLLHKRYGPARTLAYNCLLMSYTDRRTSIYQWIRTGKLKQHDLLTFVSDFLITQTTQYTTSDVEQMISFVGSLKNV